MLERPRSPTASQRIQLRLQLAILTFQSGNLAPRAHEILGHPVQGASQLLDSVLLQSWGSLALHARVDQRGWHV